MAVGTKGLAPSELDAFDTSRLNEELRRAKEELFNLRFQSATGQLEGHGRLRAVKRDIARIYTVLRERELGIRPTPAPVETPAAAPKARRGRKAEPASESTGRTAEAESAAAAEVTAGEPATTSSETTEEKS
jgi:large subunit ribosomal protein L29